LPVEILRLALPPLLADRLTMVGFRLADGPEGITVSDRLTVPEKLLRLVRLMVDVAEAPCGRLREDGFADRVKSGVDGFVTVTETVAECVIEGELLWPVTVTV
jgi:hypothetical protein